jgi:P27 family predicted phage terminase small subunit
MGARGPAPESIETAKLHGTYRHSRHGNRRPPKVGGRPRRPRALAGEARKFWDAVAPRLAAAGVVTVVDVHALQACAEMWARYRAASAACDADPTDKNARVAAVSYLQTWIGLAAKLGLTPADRQRLVVNPPAESDPLDEFLNRGRGVSAFARRRVGLMSAEDGDDVLRDMRQRDA